jgi:putative phosphoesterase
MSIEIEARRWPFMIGCVSDTHVSGGDRGLPIRRVRSLPSQVLGALAGADLIVHAGDLVTGEVLEDLGTLAPVQAVAGNMDPPSLAVILERVVLMTIGPWRVGLTHGDLGPGSTTPERARRSFPPDVDVIVFGHSHQPLCQDNGGALLLNPGSPTDYRRAPGPTCGLLILGGPEKRTSPQGRLIWLDPVRPQGP